MSENDILLFLRCPSSALVDLALSFANLTWKEEIAIDLCGKKAKTQEQAAEDIDYSVDAVHRWYRSGMKKLCAAWSGIWWIQSIVDSIK